MMKKLNSVAVILLIATVFISIWSGLTNQGVVWFLSLLASLILSVLVGWTHAALENDRQKSFKENFEKEWERMTEEEAELD